MINYDVYFQNKENKDLINAINFILGYKTRKPELFKLALLHKSIKQMNPMKDSSIWEMLF